MAHAFYSTEWISVKKHSTGIQTGTILIVINYKVKFKVEFNFINTIRINKQIKIKIV